MKKQDFKISFRAVLILVGANTIFAFFGALAHILRWESADLFLTLGIIFFFTWWIILLNDMMNNKIYNKSRWVLNMFIFPYVTPWIYLFKKGKLNRKELD